MKALALINEAVVQEQFYKLSSTQINLPAAHADYLLKWGREMIPNEHLYYDDKGGLGREDEIHVTVLYGIKGAEPSKELLALIKKTLPFTARLTSVTLFDNNPDYDVVKFDVDCDELVSLSNALRQACPNENKYPDYHPHVTIAYVKKGRVPDLAGNYPFQQNPPIPSEFEVNEIIFKPAGDSDDPNRKPIRIPLNRYRQEAEDPKATLRTIGAKQYPRLTDGSTYADVDWEDIRKLQGLGRLGVFNGRAFPIISAGPGHALSIGIVQYQLGRRLRWYRWITVKESEDPKAVLKHLPHTGFVVRVKLEPPQRRSGSYYIHFKPNSVLTSKLELVIEPQKATVFSRRAEAQNVADMCAKQGLRDCAVVPLPITEAESPKAVLKKAKEAKSRKENGGVLVLPPVRGRLLPARPVRRMGEAEDPKVVFKQAASAALLKQPARFKDVPEGKFFRLHSSGTGRYVKRNNQCYLVTIKGVEIRYNLGNPEYICYPLAWDDATTKSYGRHLGEAETPKMALKLKRITRALMFKHVPEGFYFRSPWYPMVKKQLDPETGCNAVTADLDMVRPLKFEPDSWVFPVEWTIDDITNGKRLESLLEAQDLAQCAKCGVKCCSFYPGESAPEDWGAPDLDAMRLNITQALDSGKYEIDYWYGGLAGGGDNDIMMVRPGGRSNLTALALGLDGRAKPCRMQTPTGCELPYEQRPRQCRELVPGELVPGKIGKCQDKFSKKDAAAAWLPYQDLLFEIVRGRYEGLDEAEDPKAVFHLATAAGDRYYIQRTTDAYGKWLAVTHYLKTVNGAPAWTVLLAKATLYRSSEEAEAEFTRMFGGEF